MMTGSHKGETLGACTDCRRFWAQFRAGKLSQNEIDGFEGRLATTVGTCPVMGTASTMACLAETMGITLPGTAAIPAVHADRLRAAEASGELALRLTQNRITPDRLITPRSVENALRMLLALGGSTNAIIHLLAIARRSGVELTLDDLQDASDRVPLLVNCKPSGVGYMEDFHIAGGLPVLLKTLEPLLDLSVSTITGQTLGEILTEVSPPQPWQETIYPLNDPLGPTGSLVVIKGNLAPDGAILKASAASANLFNHRGPAVVFESPEDAARIDDPSLQITPDHVMILRNAGPVGAGMPEAGSLPIPRYLAEKGIKDMVRISDARMSGTAYGTVVLHCSPEAATGGPLALVKNGDEIELNVTEKRIDLLVDTPELSRRKKAFTPPESPERGWRKLFAEHVLPAHLGADMDFL